MRDECEVVEPAVKVFGIGEPTYHFSKRMRACCLKCGHEWRVEEFSFVCAFCGCSSFCVQGIRGRRPEKGGPYEYH